MLLEKSEILDLGRRQALLFQADNLGYCERLITTDYPRQFLSKVYWVLVRREKIIPKEDMLQDQKELSWQTAKEIAKGRLGRKDLVELVHALLAIEYFLNL